MGHALHIAGFHDTKQKFMVTGEPKKLSVDMTPKLCGSVDILNVTGVLFSANAVEIYLL